MNANWCLSLMIKRVLPRIRNYRLSRDMPVRSGSRSFASDVSSILVNGAYLTGTQWSEAVLRAAFVVVIARVLGAEAYGVWSYAMGAYMLGVTCSIMGTDVMLARQLGRAPQDSTGFLAATLGLRLMLLFVAAFVLGIYAAIQDSHNQLQFALLLSIPALFGRGVALLARPVMTGLERAGSALVITGSSRLLEVVVGIGLLIATRDILLLVAWHALSWMVEAALTLRWLRRATALNLPRFSRDAVLPIFRAGLPIGAAAIAIAAQTSAPVLLAVPLGFDVASVGQLGIALQLAALVTMAVQGFLNASLPVLARRTAGDGEAVAGYGWIAALVTLLVYLPTIGLAWLFGEAFLTLLLGDGFTRAADLLWLALLVGWAAVLPNGFWQILVVSDRQRAGVLPSWGGLVLALALLFLTPLQLTLEGILWASLWGWLLRAGLLILASMRPRGDAQKST